MKCKVLKAMGRFVLILLSSWITAGTIFTACTGQNDSPSEEKPAGIGNNESTVYQGYMEFDTLVHDFGTLIEGEQVVCYFDYTNTGDGDMVIQSVETSCGCTVPDWSGKPLKPGDKASIRVMFDTSGRFGDQAKVITIRSNARNAEVRLRIKAHI
jgi:hypothetical protein